MSDWLFGTQPAREPWNTLSPWARRWWEDETGRAWRLLWEQAITHASLLQAPTWHDVHPAPRMPS